MPEAIRALVYLMLVAVPTLVVLRKALTPALIATEDFDRRRVLWIGLTVFAFLCHSFFLFLAALAVALIRTSSKERNRLALFTFLMFVMPNTETLVSGIGPINQLLPISPLRAMSVVLLLPMAIGLRRDPSSARFGSWTADKALIGYVVLQAALQFPLDSFTSTSRSLVINLIDIVLPYYVASRGVKTVRDLQDVCASFVVSVGLMAAIGIFESVKHWLIYQPLLASMNIWGGLNVYISRGFSIRAAAASGHSIILGFCIMIALAFYYAMRTSVPTRVLKRTMLIGLIGGLFVTLSRGPWIATALVGGVIVALAPGKKSDLLKAALGIGAVLGIGAMTPFGRTVISLLPFFGSSEGDTLDYRQRLLEVSLKVIAQNPVFGSFGFRGAPEMQELVQGEGIIDIVNTYLGIALTFGLVGLTLFVTPFIAAVVGTLRVVRSAAQSDPGFAAIGTGLVAALLGTALMLTTMSMLFAIPVICWLLVGLCLGYAQIGKAPRRVIGTSPAVDLPARYRSVAGRAG